MTSDDRGLRMEPARAKELVDAGEAIILDVVESNAWAEMHRSIQGALRMDPEEIADRLDELPGDRKIIAYCT